MVLFQEKNWKTSHADRLDYQIYLLEEGGFYRLSESVNEILNFTKRLDYEI